jgi:ribose-phosphate pyrophosphokinase
MNLKVFAGSDDSFAKKVCGHLSIPLGAILHHKFPSDEFYCQYKENIRGSDVFLIQSLSKPVNENLMQLLIMADAARRASAGRITAVIPYLGYSRQDRKDKSRTPISAKLVLDVIQSAGINRVITMDLHAPQIAGFTNLPFDHLSFSPKLCETILEEITHDPLIQGGNMVFVAPDVGAVKRVETFAKKLGCPIAILTKNRLSDTEVDHTAFIGDVNGKSVVIVDDLTESCSTLIGAAKSCKEHGAKNVVAAVTHACITGDGVINLSAAMRDGVIDRFIHSNTVTFNYGRTINHVAGKEGVREICIAGVFARAIRCVHENESISELF